MTTATEIKDADLLAFRRFEIACEQEALSRRPLTQRDRAMVDIATKGERFNARLYASIVAEKWARRYRP